MPGQDVHAVAGGTGSGHLASAARLGVVRARAQRLTEPVGPLHHIHDRRPQPLTGLLDHRQVPAADHQDAEPVGAPGPQHHVQALDILDVIDLGPPYPWPVEEIRTALARG